MAKRIGAMVAVMLFTMGATCRVASLSAGVGRPQQETDGAILVSGTNFPAATTYDVGIWTSGPPRMIGKVTTDSGGNIDNVKLEYECRTLQVIPIHVEVYTTPGEAGIAQTVTDAPPCF